MEETKNPVRDINLKTGEKRTRKEENRRENEGKGTNAKRFHSKQYQPFSRIQTRILLYLFKNKRKRE